MKIEQEPKYDARLVRGDDGREGRLINRASGEPIPDDEPIFILRARDIFAVATLEGYQAASCEAVDNDHFRAVMARLDDFKQFASEHPDRMKVPDTQWSQ